MKRDGGWIDGLMGGSGWMGSGIGTPRGGHDGDRGTARAGTEQSQTRLPPLTRDTVQQSR